jgi:hypothetical protein
MAFLPTMTNPALRKFGFPDRGVAPYWASEDYREDPGYYGLGVILSGTDSETYSGQIVFIKKSDVSHAYAYAVRSSPSRQPAFNDDGYTVSDPITGLTWQKETLPTKRTWQEALHYVEGLSLAGFSDWRLPNINELQSLADYSRSRPAISSVLADDTYHDLPYWSSTSVAGGGDDVQHAKTVSFAYGFTQSDLKTDELYVRAVRSGNSVPVGVLRVDIEPAAAREAEMQWRARPEAATSAAQSFGSDVRAEGITGWPEWHDSGAEVRVATGTHRITFRDFDGWQKPADIVVNVTEDKIVREGEYDRISSIPTLSEWGMLVMIGLLLLAGGARLRQQRGN